MKKLSVALAAIFLSSVSNGAEPAKATPSSGRFQLVQLSSMRSDQYLLDTQTGKMWSRECWGELSANNSQCSFAPWIEESIEGITASLKEINDRSERLKKAKVQPD